MTKKTPIRIIKRDERNRQENAAEQAKPVRKTAQETARDMVGTVTNWVNEFQQKRRTETTRAIHTLFPDPPQPNEA
jgi:formylglycine-generating enzyme required for sulfatase activity